MATFIIRVLKGNPAKRAKGGFFRSINDLTRSFESVNVLADSDSSSDLELRWTEERTINNVVAEGGTKSIQISLEKTGYLSIRDCGRYWYASNLGRHSISLSSKALASFELAPIKLDLRASLSKPIFKGVLLENVRVSDLSVDTIPSLKAEIPSCTQAALLELVEGTEARVISFAVAKSTDARLAFSTNGTVKVRLSHLDWAQAVQEIEDLVHVLIPTK
jgi:hypothetical protein